MAAAFQAAGLATKSTAKKAPLNYTQWLLAYDRFAIAAAVTGMCPYAAAIAHKVRGATHTHLAQHCPHLVCVMSKTRTP